MHACLRIAIFNNPFPDQKEVSAFQWYWSRSGYLRKYHVRSNENGKIKKRASCQAYPISRF